MAWLDEALGELVVGHDAVGRPVLASIEDVLVRFRVPGLSIAVVEDGRIVESAGFGIASSDVPMMSRTVGLAGSTSKIVAAAGALALVARGVLDLDTDVDALLTSWHVPARGGWTAAPTLRQILSHTAGFTVHGFTGYPAGEPVPSLLEVLNGEGPATNVPVTVDFVPGTAMRYSGGGYVVLMQVIEDVTGRPFADVMHEVVLDPCGMADSSFANPPAGAGSVRSSGHHVSGVEVRGGHYVYPEAAAAGLWTTVEDLGRFIGSMQRSLAGDETGLPRLVADGLVSRQFGGRTLGASIVGGCVFHAGADVGHVSSVLGSMDGTFGLALMSNSDLGLDLFPWIDAAVAKARSWRWPPAPTSAAVSTDDSPAPPPPGRYELEVGGQLLVDETDGRLEVTFDGQAPLALVPGERAWHHHGIGLAVVWDEDQQALSVKQATGNLIAYGVA